MALGTGEPEASVDKYVLSGTVGREACGLPGESGQWMESSQVRCSPLSTAPSGSNQM